ncbi:MAG: class I SAM-dependent methyltransferase [Actinomycetota bacterium]|nr:class I SAM-dependent methyltransferase [Actinomycetota bacterium]
MGDERTRLVQAGYDRIAETYANWGDATGGAKAAYTARVRHLVAPGATILDLGCGTGEQVTRHLTHRHHMVGIDISPRSIAAARRRVPAASFVLADMATVGFRRRSVDAVIAFFSLIHVPREDHATLLASIRTWLRPGGHLVVTMGAGAGGEGTGDFLGAEMYWSNWDGATNLGLVTAAGLDVISAEERTEDENGIPVTHLWVVAKRC